MKYKTKLDKIILFFFIVLSLVVFTGLFLQYNYSKKIVIQNFVNKHFLDTMKIKESFKSLLDKAQYYFKAAEDENIKFLNTLPLFYSRSNFDVNRLSRLFSSQSAYGKYELFVINRDYKIIKGSYKPDVGYDLGKLEAYRNILKKVFSGKEKVDISMPHLDTSSMNLKRYYLILSPDKKYLLQLAFVVDMFTSAKKLYNKIMKETPDLKDLEVYYIDTYLIHKINFQNRYQKKQPLNVLENNTNRLLKEILGVTNDFNDTKELYRLVDMVFERNHCVIKKLDFKTHSLIFYTIIKGVFETSKTRLLIKSVYDTKALEKDIESLRQKFLYIFLAVVVGIFLIYKFVIDKVSKEIKEIVYHMKNNKKLEDESSFIEEINDLKQKYNEYHQKLNKEIEKNQILLEENRRFILDTVHQIKTPMSVITLNLDYIKSIVNNDEVNELIDEVDAAIAMLVNSYNDLSYVASNDTVKYIPQKLNLSEFIKERIHFFSLIAKANNKEIHTDIEPDLYFNINQIEFERLIDNNISNAIKYSKKRDIYVSLKKGDNIVLKVESFGEKIKNPKEVFEKNYREHSHKRGLGIGLNIVKNICRKYNISYKTYYENGKNIFEYVFRI